MGHQLFLPAILIFLSTFTKINGDNNGWWNPLASSLLNLENLANLLSRGIIVFEDNFNGDSLDMTKWEFDTGCEGFGEGILNCYVGGSNNTKVANGLLQITAKVENNNGRNYTSARIRQQGGGYQNGVFVARMKLPRGRQLVPAFWLLETDTTNPCKYQEIDIFKFNGENVSTIYTTALYGRNATVFVQASRDRTFKNLDFSKEFHEFSLVWTTEEMTWYVDTQKIGSVHTSPLFWEREGQDKIPCGFNLPFDEPFQAIFNLDVGGPFLGDDPPITAEEAQNWDQPTLFVYWFRIYQLPFQIIGSASG